MTACSSLGVPVDDSDVILSNYSVSLGSTVQIGCRMFGRRLTSGVSPLFCRTSTTSGIGWKTIDRDSLAIDRIFTCKWNGELNTYEKLIIGMGSAGVGLLIFGTILICCLAYIFRSKRDFDSDIDSYPPSQINEKVSYAQPYGDGHRDGGGGSGGIRGYRASGKYEKQITDSRNDYPRSGPYSISDPRSGPDTGKRDPFLWSEYNAKNSRETPKPETGSGYQYYKGKPSQYDNRAFENDRGPGGYRETGHSGTNYLQGKREDYRWNSNTGIPRAHT